MVLEPARSTQRLTTFIKGEVVPPQASNIAFYRSDELEELLLRGVKETDPATVTATYRAAQELIRKDAPWIVMAHAKRVAVVRANIEQFTLHPISWRPLWRARIGAE